MTATPEHVVIVGGGQAGGDLAANLREFGFTGRVTLIGDETTHPYSRHPLSKAFLRGEKSTADLLIRAEDMYERFDIVVRTGERVDRIDREGKQVVLADGQQVGYDALVLATGGTARRLPLKHLDGASNVFYLRAIEHAELLRSRLTPGRRLTVVGGGYIGLEVAAVARQLGLDVTVVERESRLLARVTSPVTSEIFAQLHRDEGVALHLGTSVADFVVDDSGDVCAVVLDDGTRVETDVCLVGIGLVPNMALAEAAGIAVADGVLVDELFRTNDPDVFAIGDVARFPHRESGESVRLESIPNSTEQSRAVARVLSGEPAPYDALPWFWSDQYHLKLQAVGLMKPTDDVVVRGVPGSGPSVSIFYLRDGVVRAAEVLSSPRDFAAAKRLVSRGLAVDPVALADVSVPLGQLRS